MVQFFKGIIDSVAKCFLELKIYRKGENYNYKLNTPTRNFSGELTLKLDEKNDGYYITINGIEWTENLGSLDEEGSPLDENIKLPQGLEGFLRENSITIQNYGNSMNYYMQLGECDTKYIALVKNSN